MNEQVKVEKSIAMGDGSGYNGTNVLLDKGAFMADGRGYPAEWVKEMAVEAFEAAEGA